MSIDFAQRLLKEEDEEGGEEEEAKKKKKGGKSAKKKKGEEKSAKKAWINFWICYWEFFSKLDHHKVNVKVYPMESQ